MSLSPADKRQTFARGGTRFPPSRFWVRIQNFRLRSFQYLTYPQWYAVFSELSTANPALSSAITKKELENCSKQPAFKQGAHTPAPLKTAASAHGPDSGGCGLIRLFSADGFLSRTAPEIYSPDRDNKNPVFHNHRLPKQRFQLRLRKGPNVISRRISLKSLEIKPCVILRRTCPVLQAEAEASNRDHQTSARRQMCPDPGKDTP